ncbi:MAG: DMT family transporter [Agarilytica sp.]
MRPLSGEFLFLCVTILAAAGWVFSKLALEGFPPFIFMAIRFSIAALVLMLFCLPQLHSLSLQQLFRCSVTGVLFGLTLMLWVMGLAHTALVGESAFIVSLSVILVPIVGYLVFSEKIPSILFVSLVPAVAGLALLSLENSFNLERGQWFFVLATFGFALHLNMSSHFVAGISSLANTTVQLVMVAIVSTLGALMFETFPEGVGGVSWMWLLLSAVVATSLRFALQNKALLLIAPSHAAIIFLVEPVWTVLAGVLILGEVLPFSKVMGCCFIFAALLVYRSQAIVSYIKSHFAQRGKSKV